VQLHCPCCHAQFAIEALTQDEAARELLALRPAMLPSLLPYLTLFRTGKRSLAFDTALKLAKEAMVLDSDLARLEAAMAATVDSLRAKREEGQGKPLKNHNYLKKVLADTPGGGGRAVEQYHSATPPSKTAKGITRLESWKKG
jgi:hypothetical protein